MLGPVLLAAARSDSIRRLVAAAPVTRPVVNRFVAGERLDESMAAVRSLAARGLEVTLDHLGEDITDPAEALRNRDAYLQLAAALKEHGLGVKAEMSVKLSAFGQALAGGHELALKNVTPVVEAAAEAGTTVTLDMEDHTTVDSTLAILADLRERFPRRVRCSSPTSSVPRTTAVRSPGKAPGCGWSRVRTRSPRPSPSRTSRRSTRPMCAA